MKLQYVYDDDDDEAAVKYQILEQYKSKYISCQVHREERQILRCNCTTISNSCDPYKISAKLNTFKTACR